MLHMLNWHNIIYITVTLHIFLKTILRILPSAKRLNLRITYRCFCRWLCTRYEFESRYRDRHKLSPCTVLGYFKRERGG